MDEIESTDNDTSSKWDIESPTFNDRHKKRHSDPERDYIILSRKEVKKTVLRESHLMMGCAGLEFTRTMAVN